MGQYLNPATDLLKENLHLVHYIDKSEIILTLNSLIRSRQNTSLLVTRPSRFGKTFITNLLCAYYSSHTNSTPLFQNLKLSSHTNWDIHLNSLNVILIDVQGIFCKTSKAENLTSLINKKVVEELSHYYPNINKDDTIVHALSKTNEQFFLILDEYDILLREDNISKKAIDTYTSFLNDILDSNNKNIVFTYLTGILPMKNIYPTYISTMIHGSFLSSFFGFTKEEVESITTNKEKQSYYKGYKIGNTYPLFNCLSITKSYIKPYWPSLVPYPFKHKIKDKKRININKNSKYTYLTHIGYLSYDENTKVFFIPTQEIKDYLSRRKCVSYALFRRKKGARHAHFRRRKCAPLTPFRNKLKQQ